MKPSTGTFSTQDRSEMCRYDDDSRIILELIQVVNDLIRRVDRLEKVNAEKN